MQIRPGRSPRYTQHLSNLRVRKALDIMQHYHRPRTIRKVHQRRLEPLPQLATLRRIAERGRYRFGELLRFTYLPPAGQIERRIRDDSIEPRPESLCGIEPLERLIRAQKSLLHRILGVLVRHDDRAGHYVCAPLMKTHEPGKTPLVSTLGETDELSLFIRNTYGGVGLLRGWQRRRGDGLPVRYGGRNPSAVVRTPARECHLRLVNRSHRSARATSPEQQQQRQSA